MARVRLFVGVGVDHGVRGRAVALQRAIGKCGADVKWVGDDAMHVTLNFLGDVDDRDLPAVFKAVSKAAKAAPPFRLGFRGVGAFPTARRPKTLWAGVADGADDLRALYAAMEPPLIDIGVYRREERGYTPHLTLGRTKADADGQLIAAELPKYEDWDGGDTFVEEVRVYSSDLYPEGPLYTVLGRAELTGRG